MKIAGRIAACRRQRIEAYVSIDTIGEGAGVFSRCLEAGAEPWRIISCNNSNQPALEAFIGRKEGGLGLSDRVWDYSEQFREEIELALDAGIRDGLPATRMATRLKAYLKHPDKLFRRVRDDHGQLRLSKAAKAYHPGRGVYRSSFKNARRLAATETNMAYRTADHLRWQQMDFVVGQRVVLSNNHTLGGKRFRDICDDLSAPQGSTATSGRGCYPKDFKFTGWHPLCRCHAEPILKTPEEMQADTRRILAGGEPATRSANEVKDVPQGFKDWIEDNKERMERAKSLPYFIRDNKKAVGRVLKGAADNVNIPLPSQMGEKRTQAEKSSPLGEADKKRRKEIIALAKKKFKGIKLKNPNFPYDIELSATKIKELVNQPHGQYVSKNEAVLHIDKLFSEAKNLKEVSVKDKEHVSRTFTLETSIKGQPSWFIIHMYKTGRIALHSITDNESIFDKGKK